MALPTICFIVNPVAGGRDKRNIHSMIQNEFSSDEFQTEIVITSAPEEAFKVSLEKAGMGIDMIVAVGGDGTINEVVKALINKKTVLGVVPFGSGNGFARHFRIPLDIKKSLKILKSGIIKKIDIGFANNIPFACTTGIGFDAEEGHKFENLSNRGFWGYAFSFLKVFFRYRSRFYELKIDNKESSIKAFMINIANISQFGYNFSIAPAASVYDKKLDLTVIKPFPKLIAPVLVARSFFGKIHKSRYVFTVKCEKIEIRNDQKRKKIQIDGEPFIQEGQLIVQVKPAILQVILP